MYGLPPDVDLTFFEGENLQQVCIGANEVILRFGDNISLTVMSPIACGLNDQTIQKYENYREAASCLTSLLDHVVMKAMGDRTGMLRLEFRGGGRIVAYDDSNQYESYLIKNRDKLIVV